MLRTPRLVRLEIAALCNFFISLDNATLSALDLRTMSCSIFDNDNEWQSGYALNDNRSLKLTEWQRITKTVCYLAVADCVVIQCHSMPFIAVGLIPIAPILPITPITP